MTLWASRSSPCVMARRFSPAAISPERHALIEYSLINWTSWFNILGEGALTISQKEVLPQTRRRSSSVVEHGVHHLEPAWSEEGCKKSIFERSLSLICFFLHTLHVSHLWLHGPRYRNQSSVSPLGLRYIPPDPHKAVHRVYAAFPKASRHQYDGDQ
jgi:hypothetical protein